MPGVAKRHTCTTIQLIHKSVLMACLGNPKNKQNYYTMVFCAKLSFPNCHL